MLGYISLPKKWPCKIYIYFREKNAAKFQWIFQMDMDKNVVGTSPDQKRYKIWNEICCVMNLYTYSWRHLEPSLNHITVDFHLIRVAGPKKVLKCMKKKSETKQLRGVKLRFTRQYILHLKPFKLY